MEDQKRELPTVYLTVGSDGFRQCPFFPRKFVYETVDQASVALRNTYRAERDKDAFPYTLGVYPCMGHYHLGNPAPKDVRPPYRRTIKRPGGRSSPGLKG